MVAQVYVPSAIRHRFVDIPEDLEVVVVFAPAERASNVSSAPWQHLYCPVPTVPVAVADVLGLLDDLGVEDADVVGHDWGSALGWVPASVAPERVRRFVAVSVGHPGVRRHLGVEHREKSWYMLFFQFPEAEQLRAADDWKLFRELLRDDGDIDRYLEDLSRPGALTAALNWYRANLCPPSQLTPPPALPLVAAPVLGRAPATR